MENHEPIQVIDLGDPQTLHQLATDEGSPVPFISEFSVANENSDIEDEEPDDLPVRRGQPIYRESLDEDNDEDDGDDDGAALLTTWRNGATPAENLNFSGPTGLQVAMEDTTPMDYLRLMVMDEMVLSMVTETNRYATQTLAHKELSPNSRFHRWMEVTLEEMWAFLGLIVSMGLIVIDYLEDYWSMDAMYKLPFYTAVMNKDKILYDFGFFCTSATMKSKFLEASLDTTPYSRSGLLSTNWHTISRLSLLLGKTSQLMRPW
ncbi:PiggyBac transposable element-derived protein 4 [Plakobranchus ocellatus]|uniref:PiggyBac transposable element-derived protein 4 n=1 Tax=Plakobranchus ocellatus TaxID=259542 RepID=A0AAV3Z9A2_9GAST|nr:PiggyBac transposable element-derived protein 4 [Plakobranchus ocellatus]